MTTGRGFILAPGEANLGLGCGNPISIAELQPGETVLDLGSGAGFDAFLAAKQVGDMGNVIGMDMTPEMVRKARENAEKLNISNVDFRLGKIEELPVSDNSVDVVISNCVINLSPDKSAVFMEIYRSLSRAAVWLFPMFFAQEKFPKNSAQPGCLYRLSGGCHFTR